MTERYTLIPGPDGKTRVMRDGMLELGTLSPDPEGFWVECSFLSGVTSVETEGEGVAFLKGMLQAWLVLAEEARNR